MLLHRYKILQNIGEFENSVQEKRKIRYIMQRMEMPISIAVIRCVTLLRNVVRIELCNAFSTGVFKFNSLFKKYKAVLQI